MTGRDLKILRIRNHVMQKDVARELGVAPQRICAVEKYDRVSDKMTALIKAAIKKLK